MARRELVIDASAIMCVFVGEPRRRAVLKATLKSRVVAPQSVYWEIGNALAKQLRKGFASKEAVGRAIVAFRAMEIEYVGIDLAAGVWMAHETNCLGYDGFVLACAKVLSLPLLTLDAAMMAAAIENGISVVRL